MTVLIALSYAVLPFGVFARRNKAFRITGLSYAFAAPPTTPAAGTTNAAVFSIPANTAAFMMPPPTNNP